MAGCHSQSLIRLLLVDDHPVMRAGLVNLLATQSEFAAVTDVGDGETALRLWRQKPFDLCLLDLTMPGLDGVETLIQLRGIAPAAKVLILTSSNSAADLSRALSAGAVGYITKDIGHQELLAAIHAAIAGDTPISHDSIIDNSPIAAGRAAGLSPREIEVVALMREGYTNNDIGRMLGISHHTAKAHVAAVMTKLASVDRTQAVARAFDLGILRAQSG